MKKHKKFNRTKTIVLLIIALLGLYVVSTKSAPMSMRTAAFSSQTTSINELQNQVNTLKSQMRNTLNPTMRAELAAKIASLEAEINRMQAFRSNVMRPKS